MKQICNDFDWFAEALEVSYRMISVCLPGRSTSDWLRKVAGYQPVTYLADPCMLVNAFDLEAVNWIGTSFSGSLQMLIDSDEDPVARGLIRCLVRRDIGPVPPASCMQQIADRVGWTPDFADLQETETYQRKVCAEWG